MITKKDIITFGNKIAKHAQGSTESPSMHPFREWVIGLGFLTLLFVSGAIYAVSLFASQVAMVERETDMSIDVAVFEDDLLEEVLSVYRERRALFMMASGGGRGVVGTSTSATTTIQIVETIE